MSVIIREELRKRKRRIERRLATASPESWPDHAGPVLGASNIHYEIADRARGIGYGGIGAIHLMGQRIGLIEAVDANLHLLRVHLPYHESDHILNFAYNTLCGGTCIEDIERLRNDEVYLDALGAARIPDPTTAGDFCRRFSAADVDTLMDIFNEVRVRVWRQQPRRFFKEAVIDADGTIAPTNGECKQGMGMSYKGEWGYAPLLISLANTGEPLFLVNRPGNRPSHEGAAERLDQAIALCRRGGFKKILLRGDTDFSQTAHLDRWNDEGVKFIFGMDASPNLITKAQNLPEEAWKRFVPPPKYKVSTEARRRPENVKEQIVVEKGYTNLRLKAERVAEFQYSPTLCKNTYRVVVLEKNISVEKGENVLYDEKRYFFWITNVKTTRAGRIVERAHERCDQENLIEQLKNGVRAMRMPVSDLIGNWAYMVMASLAWSLKAWFALLLPENGRWGEKHESEKKIVLRMEFKQFLNAFMLMPCQIVKTGRRIVYRLLSWNPWQHVFFRALKAFSQPLRC